MNIAKKIGAGIATLSLVAFSVLPSFAASTVVVTPTNTQGWTSQPPTADTRPGGNVNFVPDSTDPGNGNGALQLTTTDALAKAQYIHTTNTSLADVSELSYYTKQVSGPAVADPSYQIGIDLNGSAAGGFTTLVYEPYWNGTVTPGVWQSWDVYSGKLWSSRSFTDTTNTQCSVSPGGGGEPFYTLSQLKTACPNAVIVGYGLNIGSNNAEYNVEADLFNFNGTTYDFELYATPTSKDQCKDDGYKGLRDNSGNQFKNQGDCVSYIQSNPNASGNSK